MERKKGVVLRWNERGFGFLFSDEVGRKIFFHVRNWNRIAEPVVGDEVEFELGPSRNIGHPDEAFNVTPVKINLIAGAAALASKVGV